MQTENETQEARDQRTSLVRQRMAAYRENQNEEDRNVQRLLARQRMAEYRSQETEDVRNQRLSLNRQSMAEQRLNETNDVRITWIKAAFSYNPVNDYASNPKITIGSMDNICRFCHARKWPGEPPGMCCTGSKVRLEAMQAPPEVLMKLLTEDTHNAKHFRSNIWKYNAAFMMTSFGAHKNLTTPGFFTTFKVQGQVYHRIGGLLPLPNEEPNFSNCFASFPNYVMIF